MDDEEVPVRAMALGRPRTDELPVARVVPQLHGSLGETRPGLVTDAGLERGRRHGDVRDRPVPVARRGRRVGVEDGHGEALRPLGEPGPRQLGRDVLCRRRPGCR